MFDWLRLFKEVSDKINCDVKPFFGSKKARETMGRGAGGDVSKYIDILAEDIVVEALENKDVSCTLISEECGKRNIGKGGENYVILDSVDGTTNATRNIPFVATSLAHATGEKLSSVDVAFVKDLYHCVDFTATKGRGAFRDEKQIYTSAISSLGNAIIAIDVSSKEGLPNSIENLLPIIYKALKIRQLGSTALETCYVASGSLEAFVDLRGLTRATDLAAAYLILKEAGGIAANPVGEELDMTLKADARAALILAANRAVCNEIIECIKSSEH